MAEYTRFDRIKLTEGPYFVTDNRETRLAVVLLGISRGMPLVLDVLDDSAKLPILASAMASLNDWDLEAECRSACGWLTSESCGPDHIFGYDPTLDAYGVWPTRWDSAPESLHEFWNRD